MRVIQAVLMIFALCFTSIGVTHAQLDAKAGTELLGNYPQGLNFYYQGQALEAIWPRLHHRDSIEFPSAQSIKAQLAPYIGTPLASQVLPEQFTGDYEQLAMDVQESWRLYHAGQFLDAYNKAENLGLAGLLPRLRTLAIHHHFFVDDRDQRRDAFGSLIRAIEFYQDELQLQDPALYLLKAFCIGRYGQDLNPINAFAKGLGGKLKRNIEQAADLAPENIEALMFKAVFDAEVVAYVGGLTGRMLYGASRKKAFAYFDDALNQDSENTSLLLEYGKACLKICKRKHRDKAYDALKQLLAMQPLEISDVMNINLARTLLDHQLADSAEDDDKEDSLDDA